MAVAAPGLSQQNSQQQSSAAQFGRAKVHFPRLRAAQFSKIDRPLRRKLADGEIPELLVLFRDESEPMPEIASVGDFDGDRAKRRARLLAHRDQRKNRLASSRAKLLGKVRERRSSLQMIKAYDHVPVLHMSASDWHDIEALLDDPDVVGISSEATYYPALNQSAQVINKAAANTYSINGSGTAVAVFDTGVDYTHSAFGSCSSPGVPANCKVSYVQDFAPDDGQLDDIGHGTGVSGVVVGIASLTKLVVLDVFNGGTASSTHILAAVNWVVANAATYNIVAANFSLSDGTQNASSCDTSNPFKSMFDSLVAAEILPTVASGNDAHTGGISSPACISSGFSVGATYEGSYSSLSWPACTDTSVVVDEIACFSNSGSILDMLAPGAVINSAGTNSGGTSNAAPHVAAAVAMLKQVLPTLSQNDLKSHLLTSATTILDTRNGNSFPRLDLQTALDLVDDDSDGTVNLYDTAPLDPCVPSLFVAACSSDSDSDGETDFSEGEFSDTDSDGTPDYLESSLTDSDADGVSDELDPANSDPCIPSTFAAPCTADSDGDGKADSAEGEFTDTDSDGILDYLDSAILDTDADGVVDELDIDNYDACSPDPEVMACTPNDGIAIPLPAWMLGLVALLFVAIGNLRLARRRD